MKNLKKFLNNGYSVYELMIVLLIISILITISVPNLNKMISDIRKEKAFDILNSSIYLAKNYAINNRVKVYLTVGDKGNSTDWESIRVYTDDEDLFNYDLEDYKIKTNNSLTFNMNGQVFSSSNNLPIVNNLFCIYNDVTINSKYILTINYLGKTKFEEKNACN
jgi:prepilin-type N-terminal cleavage/methylation domain-containing protein